MVGGHGEPDVVEAIADVSNVFVLAPTFAPGVDEWCHDLVDVGPDGSVLYVVADSDLAGYVSPWTNGDGPAHVGLLALGSRTRSASAGDLGHREWEGLNVHLRSVENPGNLTKVGVELNGLLEVLTASGTDVTICFESLTTLLQYAGVEKVYKFLHVFTNQVHSVGARAHYHLDPNAHDQNDVNLLMTMLDAVVEIDGDGDVQVRTR